MHKTPTMWFHDHPPTMEIRKSLDPTRWCPAPSYTKMESWGPYDRKIDGYNCFCLHQNKRFVISPPPPFIMCFFRGSRHLLQACLYGFIRLPFFRRSKNCRAPELTDLEQSPSLQSTSSILKRRPWLSLGSLEINVARW